MSAIVAHETSCNCRKCRLYKEIVELHNKKTKLEAKANVILSEIKTLSNEIETKSEQYFKSL